MTGASGTGTGPITGTVATVTKYGPVTIHQSGVAAKELAATPDKAVTPDKKAESKDAYSLANVRLSMHIERPETAERYSVDIICITRFPDFGFELTHKAPCEMRAGQAHGAAVVQATCIPVNFEGARDTLMEVEYKFGEESLITMTIPIKFPEGSPQAERSLQLQAQAQS